jgi:nicotinate-nucleotide--dimethylbenzimidazole phosphoribosyltransferase
MTQIQPLTCFEDIRSLVKALPTANETAAAVARERESTLTKPAGALGRLEELCEWLCAWQGRHPPRVERPLLCLFAGNHGIAGLGVSAYPAEVTAQMVRNFIDGGAAINQLCQEADVEMRVHEMALETPTRDFTQEPALDESQCMEALTYGMASVEAGIDMLCLGEMGIANTTSAAALCAGLFGGKAKEWVGPGTGIAGKGLRLKARVVDAGLAFHRGHLKDPLEALRRLGGHELAAITGAVLAARLLSVPVLLDGFTCTAAASVLHALTEGSLDHCQVGHVSAEPGHRRLLEKISKEALLDLHMRLGEGTGAVLALGLFRSAVACHTGMASFAEADVSTKEKRDDKQDR